MALSWGLAVAIGIPVVVVLLAVVWPERVARGESVYDIQARVARENAQREQVKRQARTRSGPETCVTDRLPRLGVGEARRSGDSPVTRGATCRSGESQAYPGRHRRSAEAGGDSSG